MKRAMYTAIAVWFMLAVPLFSAPIQWSISSGGNDHWYEAFYVSGGLLWDEADTLARSKGGYLATITSGAENSFVYSLINANNCWVVDSWGYYAGPFVGAYQPAGSPEPGGGWQWVTGEPFSFTAWAPWQPNDTHGNQNRIQFWNRYSRAATWQDVSSSEPEYSYVVEYNPIPEPATLLLLGLGGVALRRRR